MKYGYKIDGYDILVLNEREARAGAGILFMFGLLSLSNSVMLGHIIFSKFYIGFFTIDFLIRAINPFYSPSLLLGRFFVQNQKPEYVGAIQKRFAWMIGFVLSVPMFYFLIIDFTPTPIMLMLCFLCLTLLIAESAFSICVGCKLYSLIKSEPVTNCPGDVCELQIKDKAQKFNVVQKIIVISVFIFIFLSSYLYITKIESKTFLGQNLTNFLISDATLKALEDKAYQNSLDDFNNNDF
jgi:hypothetical protein